MGDRQRRAVSAIVLRTAVPACPSAGARGAPMMPAWTRSRFLPIWIATALLFVVSAIVAPGTTSESSLQGMVPFAAILACAAAGQTLVIQQRGLDLSLPGMISLATVLMTKIPAGNNDALLAGAGRDARSRPWSRASSTASRSPASASRRWWPPWASTRSSWARCCS